MRVLRDAVVYENESVDGAGCDVPSVQRHTQKLDCVRQGWRGHSSASIRNNRTSETCTQPKFNCANVLTMVLANGSHDWGILSIQRSAAAVRYSSGKDVMSPEPTR